MIQLLHPVLAPLGAALLALTGAFGAGPLPVSDDGGKQAAAGPSLAQQIQELKAKVSRLEAALAGQMGPAGRQPGMMGGMGDKGMAMGAKQMSMKDKGMAMGAKQMSMKAKQMSMKAKGMAMGAKQMSMKAKGMAMGAKQMSMKGKGVAMGAKQASMKDKGMKMMGRMRGMRGMVLPSALPGFPGASHMYHIGATGFFLDHPNHIELSTEQVTQLNQIRESALLKQATLERQIDENEQGLWVLTGSDKPDATKIEQKVREIERLQADQRIAFIRAVGKAAGVLTPEQRSALAGQWPAGEPKAPAGASDEG